MKISNLNKILFDNLPNKNRKYHAINDLILYYKNLGIVYNPIPKINCSGIKLTFMEADGYSIKKSPHSESERYKLSNHLNKSNDEITIEDYNFFLEKQNNIKSLLVLRNPYKRIVSGYLDKIAKMNKDSKLTVVKKNIFLNQRGILPHNIESYLESGKTPTFYEFLKYIDSYSDVKVNRHFCQQSALIYLKNYSEIIDLDCLDMQWSYSLFKNIELKKHIYSKDHATSYKKNVIDFECTFYNRNIVHVEAHKINELIKLSNSSPSYKLFFLNDEVKQLFNKRFADDINLYKKLFIESQYKEYSTKELQEHAIFKAFSKGENPTPEELVTTDFSNLLLPIFKQLELEREGKFQTEMQLRQTQTRLNTIERRLGYIKAPWKVLPVIVRRVCKKFNLQEKTPALYAFMRSVYRKCNFWK